MDDIVPLSAVVQHPCFDCWAQAKQPTSGVVELWKFCSEVACKHMAAITESFVCHTHSGCFPFPTESACQHPIQGRQIRPGQNAAKSYWLEPRISVLDTIALAHAFIAEAVCNATARGPFVLGNSSDFATMLRHRRSATVGVICTSLPYDTCTTR